MQIIINIILGFSVWSDLPEIKSCDVKYGIKLQGFNFGLLSHSYYDFCS